MIMKKFVINKQMSASTNQQTNDISNDTEDIIKQIVSLFISRTSAQFEPDTKHNDIEKEKLGCNIKASDKGRCDFSGCKKKLNLCATKCRCDNTYCEIHKALIDHNCTYDYKADFLQKCAKANPKISSRKIIKI